MWFKKMEIQIKFGSDLSKMLVKKCYIERLIYNEIYGHFLHRQDLGHNAELIRVNYYYNDYFPNETITLKINYDKNYYPYQLIIVTNNPSQTITEIYTKIWDKEIVMCQLQINKDFYSKINTFQNESPWEKIKQKLV